MRAKLTVTVSAEDLLEMLREKFAINGTEVVMKADVGDRTLPVAIQSVTIEYVTGSERTSRFSHYTDPGSFETDR